ncbi:MAG: hypothetical protein AAF628_24315 [Planctomycetota bacterium]
MTDGSRQLRSILVVVLLVGGAPLTGCLDREEDLTISPAGEVHVVHRITGDQADLDAGAARYPTHAPFSVQREAHVDRDGRRKVTLRSTATFRSVDALPEHFGPARDPRAAGALRQQSRLRQWVADGKRYYRFERVYRPRAWADYAVFYRRAFDPVREHIDNADAIWRQPLGERVRVVRALCSYERMKLQQWVAAGLHDALPGGAAELAALQLRAAIANYFDRVVDDHRLASSLTERLDELDRLCAKIQTDVEDLVARYCRDQLGFDQGALAALQRHLQRSQHDFAVSQDLEDEHFVVRLELPGDLVAHNGDRVVDGHVVWEFDGRDLRDRSHRLLAISAVSDG